MMDSLKQNQEFNNLLDDLIKTNQEWFKSLLKNKGLSENKVKDNALFNMCQKFSDSAKKYLEVQQQFYQEQAVLWQSFLNKKNAETNKDIVKKVDKRFSDPDWQTNPFFAYLKENYLNTSEQLMSFIENSELDKASKDKLKFYMQQYIDAISPSNFAFTNPEVIKNVIETNGMSLVDGMKNMLADINKGYMAMSDERAFEVGKNLAITKGKVIYRNDLIELIQYSPSTDTVFEVPLLIVPPCINKYYILDLQPHNSLVKYMVDEGYTVFLISWKSADQTICKFKWEEYINFGVIDSINVIRSITRQLKVNTLGYCIGGIILTIAYLILKTSRLNWIHSITHITTMLDHENPGDIKHFIDQDLVALKEAQKHAGGIMSGRIIASTFSALRANELIWNYWVSKYLLGKTPQAFDILFWNNDAVDLPVIMHSFLLKKFYVHNDLVKGNLNIDGIKMDLSKIDCPMYLFAAQKDHIVPWKSAYKTIEYAKNADIRFVLGASGHTAGVVNPTTDDKRNYWVNEKLVTDCDEWFNKAKSIPGSWWRDYNKWLAQLSGKKLKAKKTLGNKEFKPLVAAPGEYVKAKAMPVTQIEIS